MGYLARDLDCWDCDQSFRFSVEEQGLGAELGFDDPRRCRSCRRSLENSRRAFRYDIAPRLNGSAGLTHSINLNLNPETLIAITSLRA
jgi:hypothetical protein